MTDVPLPHADRAKAAEAALEALGDGARDAVRLTVSCSRSHHLAKVYRTPVGEVFASQVSSRAHGQKDRPDTDHRTEGNGGRAWFDLIAPGEGPTVDDALPTWCSCGQRNLSRKAVTEWLAAGERRVVVT